MRKALIPAAQEMMSGSALPIASLATVLVSSESIEHPIEHAFDGQRGPGSSRWVASVPGDQEVIVAFDSPQNIREIIIEVEERSDRRVQEVQLSVLNSDAQEYRQLRCQEFSFHPDATWECEEWTVDERNVTHMRLLIKPDKSRKEPFASLTSFLLRS